MIACSSVHAMATHATRCATVHIIQTNPATDASAIDSRASRTIFASI